MQFQSYNLFPHSHTHHNVLQSPIIFSIFHLTPHRFLSLAHNFTFCSKTATAGASFSATQSCHLPATSCHWTELSSQRSPISNKLSLQMAHYLYVASVPCYLVLFAMLSIILHSYSFSCGSSFIIVKLMHTFTLQLSCSLLLLIILICYLVLIAFRWGSSISVVKLVLMFSSHCYQWS